MWLFIKIISLRRNQTYSYPKSEMQSGNVRITKLLGVDDIPSDMLKVTGGAGVIIMHKLCNKVWHSRTWPED